MVDKTIRITKRRAADSLQEIFGTETHRFNIFDANTLSHYISTPAFLQCTATPHQQTVSMWHLVCANSHIALVCVDPVEKSFWSHPFHRQTTLKQKKYNWTTFVIRTFLYRSDRKKTQQYQPMFRQILPPVYYQCQCPIVWSVIPAAWSNMY